MIQQHSDGAPQKATLSEKMNLLPNNTYFHYSTSVVPTTRKNGHISDG